MDGLKLIVLDCDGVILESVAVKTGAFGKLFLEHGPEASEKMVSYHLAHGGVSRFEKFAWFYKEVLGRELADLDRDRLNRRFTELCLDGVLKAPFVPGAMEFIAAWHKRLPLYVASGTPHEELEVIFKKRELSRFFKGIYGTPPAKDKLLAEIVRQQGVKPEETLMVGDSSTDEEAATVVGTHFYGRGVSFADSGHPWGEDLFGLAENIGKV